MFDAIARLVTRRGWLVLFGWLAAAVLLYLFAPLWASVSRDDDVRFFPPSYPSVIGQTLLERGFPHDAATSTFVIIGERPDGSLQAGDFAHLDRIADQVRQLQVEEPEWLIRSVSDHRTPVIGDRLVGSSESGGQAALVNVALGMTYIAKQARLTVNRFEELLEAQPAPPEGLVLSVTGSAAVGHDMNEASNASIDKTTYTTILLVVLILLAVYRSPLLAFIPLVTIGLSVFVGLKAIATLSLVPWINFQVINVTHVFVVVVLFGAGTDYCLFLIARYREELARGRDRAEALGEAIRQVGAALVASAGTVVVGLGMLYFSTFTKIKFTGPAIALSLAIALAAALTLAPVLLYWLRGAVFWPFRPPSREAGRDPEQASIEQSPGSATLWLWIANQVVRYPGWILSVSLLVLAPLAWIGSQTTANYSQLDDLSTSQASVAGSQVIQKYFPVGELSPTAVLIYHPTLDFRSEEGQQAVEALSMRLAALPDVAEVRSVSRPLGTPLTTSSATAEPANGDGGFLERIRRQAQQAAEQARAELVRAAALPQYVSTDPTNPADLARITRIDVVFQTDPFSPDSMATLESVGTLARGSLAPGGPLAGGETAVGLAGSTAQLVDLKHVTTKDENRMYVLVTIGVYVVLVLLLRRPGICLYLIATVVLGYLASLGATELVFRSLHNGPGPWVGLDWKVGFFLFVILVAVGEDYNILLMSRVIEEERKHGPIEGTRLAVAHTGGIISSCGLIMAGTFGSMLTGSLVSLRELGFALGLGVLLDTFIVRPILVPAFVVLWHRTFPAKSIESPAEMIGEVTSTAG